MKSNERDVIKQTISETVTEETVDPPPPDFHSNFKSLQDWLSNICNAKKPERPVTDYTFGLFESQDDDRTLFFAGLHKLDSRIDVTFRPVNMYFKLSKKEYEKLDRDQLINKLARQIRDFTKTATFKKSYLAKANLITLCGDSLRVWPK